jgi:hypothetical protein
MELSNFCPFGFIQAHVPNVPETSQNAIRVEVWSLKSFPQCKLIKCRKHDLRHTKPFMCKVTGCSRTEGFSTTNDLERHTKSKHPADMPDTAMTKRFRCLVPGCKSKDKCWPRLDNFRSHLKRVHGNHLRGDDDFDDLIRRYV